MPGLAELGRDVDPDVVAGREERRDHDRGAVDCPQHIGHAGRAHVRERHPDVHIGQPSPDPLGQLVDDPAACWITSAVGGKNKRHTGIANL
jgi:hypothetical protein